LNWATAVVEAAAPERLALVELARDGSRQEWSFGQVTELAHRFAATLHQHGVRRGDVVMTLIGNRPEWVCALVACFRQGFVALPCNEQLRAGDLRERLQTAQPACVIADPRNQAELQAASPACPIIWLGEPLVTAPPPQDAQVLSDDPALITFTSGTSGKAKAVVHAQRYLPGQLLQARNWLAAREGDVVWCTAASGWSKSARNVFIAPWLSGAAALLHDARFDPAERVQILSRERVNVLCMAPTEYRVIAKRTELPRDVPALRELVAAGEPLNPEVFATWKDATGLEIRDGYGQTETGQLTGNLVGQPAKPGSMGRPLPGVALEVLHGELVLTDPATDPTFFLHYSGEPAPSGPWHTGDRVSVDEEGYLWFEGRTDDVIISAGYRIGPFEVESALLSHEAVAEAAVVSAPDDERGSVVRAVVVLRPGFAASDELAQALKDHVKHETAPYKYPRIVEFAEELPKTTSGKIQRALLRNR
jgi:acyl-coenzyme A synthetase/AMP-(fatty) acid ligase